MLGHFNLHFLKESFMPLVMKYRVKAKLMDGFENSDGKKDGLLTLFLNFDAPGKEFSIETNEIIRHYWELINFYDEQTSGSQTMSMDPETGKMKPADDRYFVFRWRGEFNTQTTLTVDENTFLEYIQLLINENPNSPVFNLDAIKKTRVLNQFNWGKASSTNNKSGCFVATTVYGDYNAKEVISLRIYRDEVLSKSQLGKIFISTYYLFGPHIAKFVVYFNLINPVQRLLDSLICWINKD